MILVSIIGLWIMILGVNLWVFFVSDEEFEVKSKSAINFQIVASIILFGLYLFIVGIDQAIVNTWE